MLSRSFLASALVLGAHASQHPFPAPQADCVSQDSPNQHAQQYPNFAAGNLNGTTLIVPISLETARQVIPAEYGIVEKAYRELLPLFPEGMYPMMAQIVHDHDIQLAAYNASLPDFSVSRLIHFNRAPLTDFRPCSVHRWSFHSLTYSAMGTHPSAGRGRL